MPKIRNQASIPFADMEPDPGNAPLGAEKTPRLDSPCCIHVHSRRYRETDPDGCSGKAVIDRIVEVQIPEYPHLYQFCMDKLGLGDVLDYIRDHCPDRSVARKFGRQAFVKYEQAGLF